MIRLILVFTLALALAGCSSQQSTQEAAPTAGPPSGAQSAQPSSAQKIQTPTTDEENIRLATSAAPADISRNAAVVQPGESGKMREIRAGTNGWACMATPEAMCLDKEWQGWADAWMNKKDPKIKSVGIGYMLQGDKGVSNTDPYATSPTADNQWVVSPAHIMVLTPDTKQLDALPTDPYNGGPWVMWKGTKYAHIMVPVEPMPKR